MAEGRQGCRFSHHQGHSPWVAPPGLPVPACALGPPEGASADPGKPPVPSPVGTGQRCPPPTPNHHHILTHTQAAQLTPHNPSMGRAAALPAQLTHLRLEARVLRQAAARGGGPSSAAAAAAPAAAVGLCCKLLLLLLGPAAWGSAVQREQAGGAPRVTRRLTADPQP